MKILVINGPNLNMLCIREPDHYGRETYSDLVKKIERHCEEKGIALKITESVNIDGKTVSSTLIRDFISKGEIEEFEPFIKEKIKEAKNKAK